MHFPKCVAANGNPQKKSWFDHPSVPRPKGDLTYEDKRDEDEMEAGKDNHSSVAPEAASERRNTGGKNLPKATIDSCFAAVPAEEDEVEDYDSDGSEVEIPNELWRYHVIRQEIPITDLGRDDPVERTFGPYLTLTEANVRAMVESGIRDVTPPVGLHSKEIHYRFRKDEHGLDTYTFEAEGMSISTGVTRRKSYLLIQYFLTSSTKSPPLTKKT